MSRADVEAGARAALEAAAQLQEAEATHLEESAGFASGATCDILQRYSAYCRKRAARIRSLDPAAIAAEVVENAWAEAEYIVGKESKP